MKRYFYGITKTVYGIDIFAHRKRKACPEQAIIIEECIVETRDEVVTLAQEIRISFLRQPLFAPGDVVIYADSDGQHTAITLEIYEQESLFLFVTTNPRWGARARVLTQEEIGLLGYPDKGKASYFVPVIRPNKFVVPTGKTFPRYRIDALKKELG